MALILSDRLCLVPGSFGSRRRTRLRGCTLLGLVISLINGGGIAADGYAKRDPVSHRQREDERARESSSGLVV
jgi:hypothetical protein